jgi:hypothetical protein
MSKYITRKHQQAVKKLKSLGIKTVADLDDKRDPYNSSRYSYLTSLVGEDAAMWLMNDLALK